MQLSAAFYDRRHARTRESPPTDNKGLDTKVENTIDLAPDFPGYQLRLRTITFEPGGVAGFHSHKERPAFAYVLQGNLTELRKGGENRSGAKVVLMGVDIVKP